MTDQINQQPPLDENFVEEKFDFKLFASKYILRYWYLYIISVAIALIFTYYYNWYSTPLYSANCTMLFKNGQKGGNGDILSQLSGSVSDQNLDNEVEILRSRSMIRR